MPQPVWDWESLEISKGRKRMRDAARFLLGLLSNQDRHDLVVNLRDTLQKQAVAQDSLQRTLLTNLALYGLLDLLEEGVTSHYEKN